MRDYACLAQAERSVCQITAWLAPIAGYLGIRRLGIRVLPGVQEESPAVAGDSVISRRTRLPVCVRRAVSGPLSVDNDVWRYSLPKKSK
jgi:hypothetical protein